MSTYNSAVEDYLQEYVGQVTEALEHLTASASRSAQAVQDAAQEREQLRCRVRALTDELRSVQAGVRDAHMRHTLRSNAAAKIDRRIEYLTNERPRVLRELGGQDDAS